MSVLSVRGVAPLAALVALVAIVAACSSPAPATAEAAHAGRAHASRADAPRASANGDAESAAVMQKVARGRYIAAIGGCHDCHTPGYLMPGANVPDSMYLLGEAVGFRGPWGTSYAANLRLKVRELPEKEWITMVRHRTSLPPMPWPSLNHMTDEDLSALYNFIVSLGPAGTPMPAPLPPGKEPVTPYISFEPVFPGGKAMP